MATQWNFKTPMVQGTAPAQAHAHANITAEHTDMLFETELQPVCSPQLTHWRQWFEAAGLETPQKGPRMSFGNSGLALQAAISGVGFALSESVFVRDEIAAGRLVSPVDLRLRIENKDYMTVNPARAVNPGVRAFREWLLMSFAN